MKESVIMRQAASIPLKKILATEPQGLINLKLRYNTLVDKINENGMSDDEKEQIIAQLKLLSIQISYYA
jgi:hypothetical protein